MNVFFDYENRSGEVKGMLGHQMPIIDGSRILERDHVQALSKRAKDLEKKGSPQE